MRSNNLLYPQVDRSTQTLLNACRNCPYKEEAQNKMVFRNDLMSVTKEQARAATHEDALVQVQVPRMKSTTLNLAQSQVNPGNSLPENVGKHVKRVDSALPGKHTRQLYDRLSWKEASVLAQLRTGMARLNGYLSQINVAETDQCPCG